MKKILASLSICLFAGAANAAVIGQWTDSGRSWNNSGFTTIHSTLTGAGHTVEADGAITAANLANDDMFVIAEATRTLSGAETSDLASWISAGGILWVGQDSFNNEATQNTILSGLGSTLSFSTSSGSGSALVGGSFATDGIFNIVGQSLNLSSSRQVILGGSGSFLSNNVFGFQQIGSGYIFAAGDRFEHNFSNSTASSTNGKLILNIAGAATTAVPEPTILALLGIGLAGLGFSRKKKA